MSFEAKPTEVPNFQRQGAQIFEGPEDDQGMARSLTQELEDMIDASPGAQQAGAEAKQQAAPQAAQQAAPQAAQQAPQQPKKMYSNLLQYMMAQVS